MLRLTACLLLALLLTSGCVLSQSTDGVGLDAGSLEQVEIGTSTRADVTRLMGAPDEIIYSNKALDPLFESAYRYRRTKTRQTALFLLVFSTFRSDQKWDHAVIFFDGSGKVEHVGVQLDADDAEYGMPW